MILQRILMFSYETALCGLISIKFCRFWHCLIMLTQDLAMEYNNCAALSR